MKKLNMFEIEKWHQDNHQQKLNGRYIILEKILPLIKKMNTIFKVEKIGKSELGKDIFSITFGQGEMNILIWTQMHGNESTGTKAVFDLFRFFEKNKSDSEIADKILKKCKITVIPLLNPDGAEKYTRVNANQIDLNRDVIDQNAAESKVLMQTLAKVNPVYCFNIHDQRTIFSAGKENKPATLSFLAPSEDMNRTITDGRKETMKTIVAMNNLLQKFIPGQIGRYSDEFYPTATGDNFQKMGHNTILIESGHYKDDYQRENTRKYTFLALLQGIYSIVQPEEEIDFHSYFDIPNNEKKYLDIIMKNISYDGKKVDIGVLFIEKLKNGKINLIPSIEIIGDLELYNANRVIVDQKKVLKSEKELINWLKNEYIKII